MQHRVLQIQCQRQIVTPLRMLQAALVRSHQQHGLAGAGPFLLRHSLVDHVVRPQRITVDIQHDADGRIIAQILLHG